MDFDIEDNIEIFDPLFKKRPELSIETFKKDLQSYYLPYIQKLINLKQQKNISNGLVAGVSAIQGAGKTTQGEILEILLKYLGYASISLSIDDHYLTHKELCDLRVKDPRYIRRGVTHDIQLALKNITDLKTMQNGQPVIISGYDKGSHQGDGDRFAWINPEDFLLITIEVVEKEIVVNKEFKKTKALSLKSVQINDSILELPINMGSEIPLIEGFLPRDLLVFLNQQNGQISVKSLEDQIIFSGNSEISVSKKDLPKGWRIVRQKPDFIFYDGWMLGVKSVTDDSMFDKDLPALDTAEAKQFAKDVNKKLIEYEILWNKIDFITVLYVTNYQISLTWRDQAEETLRTKGQGMSHAEIREFVYYFWRSIHPAIHIKNLAHDLESTNQVVVINDDHTIGEILTPEQAAIKFP